ncbi:MAG: outer membrane protein transport protein [Chitinophagaceae bacterium]|nr:outer membrane protein transport protein [Chitinophagaceae bacterium]
MKKALSVISISLLPLASIAQAGHIMQGIGATNMSMGGAATAQPLDINGALQWNPAGISAFKTKVFSLNAGMFYSSPELSSTVPTPDGPMTGVTKDARGVSVMPALAMVWGNNKSKHTFGVSAFGISGFGVTFPQNNTNPISMPQNVGGFGHIQSDYQLMQVGVTYAYQLTDKISIGVAPTFNYSALKLAPNPLASPSQTLGYPVSNKATALGIGGQVGVFYNSGKGLKLGASYKTQQHFGDFTFKNTYLNGSAAPDAVFKMNYPSILSAGFGYSTKVIDLAIDYRFVNYKNTIGFEEKGWTPTASVKGFGWENISVVSAGIQLKMIEKVPIRVGYTYSSNPINSELAFFSIPATAIIKNAFQVGLGYELNNKFTINAVYHHGSSGEATNGKLLSPMMITPSNPYGAIPNSNVSYKMTTDMVMLGINYSF